MINAGICIPPETAPVRIKPGGPVIFKQPSGKDEKTSRLCKFRSMTDERDENGELLPDDVRLTKFGKSLCPIRLDGHS